MQMTPVEAEAPQSFPVVGIGASAGGLAAFESFFSGMPADVEPGMAFVLLQHLAPDHKSFLTDLVRRYTRMQVFEVEDGMVVQPNCVYIIPPNRDMAVLNGALLLLDHAPRGRQHPIDFFFRSLAQDQHERAICIVLSGAGSDGAMGVREVKGEGGMVMVQNPESTEYDGMPRSAIATGLADYVLPPAEMPAQLMDYAAHAFGKSIRPISRPLPKVAEALKKIFVLLRAQTGHDFSQYRPNIISRRVHRRMVVHQIDQLDEYIGFLRQSPVEVEALFRDFLIGDTSFFRDPEAFSALEANAIPRLFADKAPGAPIRVWCVGCATGEEAYSLAILLQERMETLQRTYQLQVFATDIDSRAIDTARAGLYPSSIAADLSPERLARFFTAVPDGGALRINKGIRDLLVFAEHDVIKDMPFSKLDLISCRNLLVYLGDDPRKQLLHLFNYALKPGGVLFLGPSEGIGNFADLFVTLDRPSKLYQRIENTLLQRYDAVGVLVTERGDLLYLPDSAGKAAPIEVTGGDEPDNDTRIAALKQEPWAKEEYFQTTIEELESANKELRSVNAELRSVNEELRSVNSELQTKVTDLARANNDMNNLIAGTGIGTVFVDLQLRLQYFTPAVTQVINLILSDVGRPVAHIVSNLAGYDRLVADVQEVLNTLIPRDIEVQTHAGAWFLMRIRPYRTLDNVMKGAVIAFFEITEMRTTRQTSRESETLRRLAVVIQDDHNAIRGSKPEPPKFPSPQRQLCHERVV